MEGKGGFFGGRLGGIYVPTGFWVTGFLGHIYSITPLRLNSVVIRIMGLKSCIIPKLSPCSRYVVFCLWYLGCTRLKPSLWRGNLLAPAAPHFVAGCG